MAGPIKVLGAISGSSLDGLDLALCEFKSDEEGLAFEMQECLTIEFPSKLQRKLGHATQMDSQSLLSLEIEFTRFSSRVINEFIRSSDHTPDYIASHGHTVFHSPSDGYSLQIGLGSQIAVETGIPVISDFRQADMALGGQGAPLAPIVEKLLFPGHEYYLNLGGIANLSYHNGDDILSFDSVPCNQLLNFLSQRAGHPFDAGGNLARSGNMNGGLLHRWQAVPYFDEDFPKSMDNSWVHNNFISNVNIQGDHIDNALHTAVHFMADQLKKDSRKIRTKPFSSSCTMMITGGGAHNTFLVDCIQDYLQPYGIRVIVPSRSIVDFKEALLMALMGYLRVMGLPNTIASVTGASREISAGALHLPV